MNTTDLLPPLPTPDLGMPWRVNAPDGSAHSAGYTADQMQAYAAQAVETVRSQLAHWKVFAEHAEGERSKLSADVARLERFEDWLADRAGPLLHIDQIKEALK